MAFFQCARGLNEEKFIKYTQPESIASQVETFDLVTYFLKDVEKPWRDCVYGKRMRFHDAEQALKV